MQRANRFALWSLVGCLWLFSASCGGDGTNEATTSGGTTSTGDPSTSSTAAGASGGAGGSGASSSGGSTAGSAGTAGNAGTAGSGGVGGTGAAGPGGSASSTGGNAGSGGGVVNAPGAKLLVAPKRLVSSMLNTLTLDSTASTGGNLAVLWKPARGTFVNGTTAQSAVANLEVDGDLALPVTLEVQNASGSDLASVVVPVNQAPSAVIAGGLTATVPGATATLDASPSSDPDGDPLTFAWSLENKPAASGATLAAITPTTPFVPDVVGAYTVKVTVSDGVESAFALTTLFADSADTTPPVPGLVVPNVVAAGTMVQIVASATDDVAVDTLVLTLDGQPLVLVNGMATFVPAAPALHELELVATDTSGNYGKVTANLFVHAAGATDNPNLQVDLVGPADGSELDRPTDLMGTATGNNFVGYKLEARPHRPHETVPSPFRPVAKGNMAVTNAKLGAWDTTLFENDTYDVRLTAWDGFGHGQLIEKSFILKGKRKIGGMYFSMVDARVLAGPVPIELVRKFSSLNKTTTDFGVGWTLSMGMAQLKQTARMGEGWSVSCPLFGTTTVTATRAHKVTVQLGTDTYRFVFVPNQASCFGGFGTATATFTALPGTQGTLVPDGSTALSITTGSPNITQGAINGPIYDPVGFTLTTRDKFVLHFDLQGKVDSIKDPSGNLVTFDDTGIHHGGTTELAVSRDAQGRIVSMTLPDGTARTYFYNGNGDLTRTVDFEGKMSVYEYDQEHNVTAVYGPSGRPVARYEYDAEGRLIAIIDASGNITQLDHDIAGMQEIVTDRMGNPFVYTYDEAGNMLQVVDALGHTRSATYDAEGNPLTMTNELGLATTFVYDALGQLLSVQNPLGQKTSFKYNAAGNVTERTDPKGQKTISVYDAAERVTSITHPDGSSRTMVYDAAGKLTSATLETGETHSFTFSPGSAVSGQTDGGGSVATFAVNAKKQVTGKSYMLDTGAGAKMMTTAQTYTVAGMPRLVTTPEGGTTELNYNIEGTPSGYVDADGHASAVEVNTNGIGYRLTNPGGSVLTVKRDPNDEATSMVSSDGTTYARQVDAMGRITKEVDSTGNTTLKSYDAVGRVTAVMNPLGGSTQFGYDDADRLTQVTRPDGGSVTFVHDPNGNPLSATDPLGQTVLRTVDAAGRTLSLKAPDNATLLQRTYDAAGRVLTETDGSGRTRSYTHGPYGVTSITDGEGDTTLLGRNAAGNVVKVTDALGKVTNYEIDSAGYLLSRTLPSGAKAMTTFTPSRRVQSYTDYNADQMTYLYDASGRFAKRTANDGTFEEVAYLSKLDGPPDSITTLEGTTQIARDADGRILSILYPTGKMVSYTYSKGKRTAVTTPSGTTAYDYDTSGRMTKVTGPNGKSLAATYDLRGKLTTLTYPNGIVVAYAYELATGRLSSIQASKGAMPVWGETYTRDGAGRLIQAVEQGGRTRAYAYDLAGRLTSEAVTVAGVTKTVTYTYDALGNRTSRTDEDGVQTYQYDDDHRMTSDGKYTYQYDAAGKLTKRTGGGETLTYTFDGFDRLVQVARIGGTGPALTKYGYDAFGAVSRREVDGAVEHFLNDPSEGLPVLLETEDAAGQVNINVFRPGEPRGAPWARVPKAGGNGAEMYSLLDGIDSVRAVTGPSGEALGELSYDAFGNEAASVLPEMPFRFAGERFDPATGLYDFRARNYDPGTGRFTSRDALLADDDDPSAYNPYHYAKSDPVNYVDPSGHMPMIGYLIGLDQGQKGADAAAAILAAALINIGIPGGSFAFGGKSTGQYSSSAGDLKNDLVKVYLGKIQFDDGASFVFPQADFTMMPFKGIGQLTLNYKIISLWAIGEAINVPNEYFWEGICLWAELANRGEAVPYVGVQVGQWIMTRMMMMPFGALHGWAAGGLNKVRSQDTGGPFVGSFGVFNGIKIVIGIEKKFSSKIEGKVGLGVHGPPIPFGPGHAKFFDYQGKFWPVSKPANGGPGANDGA